MMSEFFPTLKTMESCTKLWTDEEVRAFLSIYADEEIQGDFESSTRKEKVYQKISQRLSELGINHNAKQCREKIKKMKQDYKKVKDHNNRSGSDRRSGKWFAAMDAILGHRPEYCGIVGVRDSAVHFYETENSMIPQTEELPPEDEKPIILMPPSVVQPIGSSSPRPSSPASSSSAASFPSTASPHVRKHLRGKRKRDDYFIAAMMDMEQRTVEVLRQGQEERNQLLHLMLERDAQEAAALREEAAALRHEWEEERRERSAFHQGFLCVLDRLVQVMDKRNQHPVN